MGVQRKWFFEMDSTPGEDVEMTTKDLELLHKLSW